EVQRRFPNPFQHAFDKIINILPLDEGHLDVHLGEFELPVGALIFVPEATRELIISLDAADHEDLFELLGRLWQGVKGSGITAIRHEKLARAFGSALEQDRSLDLEEA